MLCAQDAVTLKKGSAPAELLLRLLFTACSQKTKMYLALTLALAHVKVKNDGTTICCKMFSNGYTSNGIFHPTPLIKSSKSFIYTSTNLSTIDGATVATAPPNSFPTSATVVWDEGPSDSKFRMLCPFDNTANASGAIKCFFYKQNSNRELQFNTTTIDIDYCMTDCADKAADGIEYKDTDPVKCRLPTSFSAAEKGICDFEACHDADYYHAAGACENEAECYDNIDSHMTTSSASLADYYAIGFVSSDDLEIEIRLDFEPGQIMETGDAVYETFEKVYDTYIIGNTTKEGYNGMSDVINHEASGGRYFDRSFAGHLPGSSSYQWTVMGCKSCTPVTDSEIRFFDACTNGFRSHKYFGKPSARRRRADSESDFAKQQVIRYTAAPAPPPDDDDDTGLILAIAIPLGVLAVVAAYYVVRKGDKGELLLNY